MTPKKYPCSKLQLDTFIGIQKSVVWEFQSKQFAGVYLGEGASGHVISPFGAEGVLPRPPPRMEKLVSGYYGLKKVNGKL